MCPSYRATREEEHSTRGRARLLFEMLQGEVITDGWRSTEVRDALDLCLSCKGCKSDCPVSVDMATYKAEFLSHHYRWRLRSRPHYSMGWLPLWALPASRAPRAVNAVARSRFSGRIVKRPEVWRPSGTFTNSFNPGIARAAVAVLEDAGFTVDVPLSPVCCGLTWISTGQLGVAERVLRRTLSVLRPRLRDGTPVVVLEPSCAAVFRSDLPELLGDEEDAHRLAKQTRTLAELLRERAPGWSVNVGRRAIAQPHCHQHAVLGFDADRDLLHECGVDVSILDAGCCGLAGNFGF